MSPIFTVILVILAMLAIIDLIVGVSNDAINFLNSSLGSKIASYRTIFSVAALGIVVGVLTSHGMMEVARKGVFHPEMFTFTEIMFLYAGVMLTDVVLLDGFNKLGLPTSTTVSMIFELLGSAVAVTVFKVYTDSGLSITDMDLFVNGGKALGMISAILVSVVLSFVSGSIFMYFSRLIFTFRYKKQFARYGALWCGIAIVGILYFAVFKGLKSSGLITDNVQNFVNSNMVMVLCVAWIISSAFLWLMQSIKVSILKITILSGTFALALAFAGNDLVNFVGVPLAGLDSYRMALASGDMNMLMGGLNDPKMANMIFLVVAGVIMALTLFLSKDAQKVSQTELTLASQQEEDERFHSTPFSRALVRISVNLNDYYRKALPNSWIDAINKRFIPLSDEERGDSNYDKIRAVVNLAAAAILISIGTSFKLPLSTTYVVFMVSMGSSLADRVWGRDSAVYRISGVVAVIMGWFVTAFIAFVVTFILTTLLMWLKGWAFAGIVLWVAYMLLKRFFSGNKKAQKVAKAKKSLIGRDDAPEDVLYTCTQMVVNTMNDTHRIYNHMLVSLFTENRHELKNMVTESERMYHEANERKYAIISVIKKLESQKVETAHYYVQIADYLSEVSKALLHCTRPAYEHINNNHRGLTGEQIKDLKTVNDRVDEIFQQISEMLATKDFDQLEDVMIKRDDLFDVIADTIKGHIKRVQDNPHASTRGSALFLNLLNETKTMVLQSRNLIKSEAYFLNVIKEIMK